MELCMHCLKNMLVLAVIGLDLVALEPLIFVKNNSNRLISIEPIAVGESTEAELVEPDGEYIQNTLGFAGVMGSVVDLQPSGLRIKYCPASYAGTACNNSEDKTDFRKFSKTAEFMFTDPKAKKYYLKFSINKNDEITLEPQAGRGIGSHKRTSSLKSGLIGWSLEGNIGKDYIIPVRTPVKVVQQVITPAKPASQPSKSPPVVASKKSNDPVEEAWQLLPDDAQKLRRDGASLDGDRKVALARAILGVKVPIRNRNDLLFDVDTPQDIYNRAYKNIGDKKVAEIIDTILRDAYRVLQESVS